MIASLAAVLLGTDLVLRKAVRRAPVATAAVAGGIVVAVGVAAAWSLGSSSSAPGSPAGHAEPTAVNAAVNLGPVINTSHREAEPSFTADGRTMYFSCDDYDLCVSHRTGTWLDGWWTTPRLLEQRISTAYLEVEPWITPSGDKLYFNSNRPFADGESLPGLSTYVDIIDLATTYTTDRLGFSLLNGLGEDELWVSTFVNGRWSSPQDLNDVRREPPVNTSFADHCLASSPGGNEAYWTSNRPGGYGADDIWTSRRINGTWTEATNLGPSVNGPGEEHHSIPSPDGQGLYVTSSRAGGFGGEDIYVTTRTPNGHWASLANALAPINGPGTDRCAAWTPDGRFFLLDSDRPGASEARTSGGSRLEPARRQRRQRPPPRQGLDIGRQPLRQRRPGSCFQTGSEQPHCRHHADTHARRSHPLTARWPARKGPSGRRRRRAPHGAVAGRA